MTDAAQDTLRLLRMTPYPVPAPARADFVELLYLGLVKDSDPLPGAPEGHRLWALTDAGRSHG